MSDVEKYGLFALIFVVGVLGLAWLLDPSEDGVGGAGGAVALRSVPVQRPDTLPSRRRPAGVLGGQASGSSARTTPLQRHGSQAGGEQAGGVRRAGGNNPKTSGAGAAASGTRTFSVPSLTADRGEFDPAEAPVEYPGEHSLARPQSRGARIEHTIVADETLTDIAVQYYGSSAEWTRLAALNPGIDPLNLPIGKRILVQDGKIASPQLPQQGSPRSVRKGRQTYVVKAGDTLGGIAQTFRGSTRFIDEIFQANRDVLASPNAIAEGMVLVIP